MNLFVINSSHDKDLVHLIHAACVQAGIGVFIDWMVEYGDFRDTRKWISNSDAVVALWSEGAQSSEYCRDEIRAAADLRKRLVVVPMIPSTELNLPIPVGSWGMLPVLDREDIPEAVAAYFVRRQPSSCFISYSTKDQQFADRLYADLGNEGIRCWFAPHDIQAGRKIHEQIDEAIRRYDRLLLILSEHSMNSEWVQTEIARARQREIDEHRQILFPIGLVSFAKIRDWKCFDADTGKDSAREIREYFIPDFSNWKDAGSYQLAFQRLVTDLNAGDRGRKEMLSWEEFQAFKERAIDPVPMGPVVRGGMNRALSDETLRTRLRKRIAARDPVYLLLDEYERRLQERRAKS